MRYNVIYPLLMTLMLSGVILLSPITVAFWRDGGIFPKLSPLLSILFPFYIAALAAVSTFSGSPEINKPFPPDADGRRVTLPMRGAKGFVVPVEISQRHFLSLLFGYCCILSLFLLFVSSFSGLLSISINTEATMLREFFRWSFFIVFTFIFFQMLVLTLLAVYYLSDKIHRRTPSSADEIILKKDQKD